MYIYIYIYIYGWRPVALQKRARHENYCEIIQAECTAVYAPPQGLTPNPAMHSRDYPIWSHMCVYIYTCTYVYVAMYIYVYIYK